MTDDEVLKQIYETFDDIDDPLSFFSSYVAPQLVGKQYDPIRQAVLLMLVSETDLRGRGRIHVLLDGPPGTGKTEVLLWLKHGMEANFISRYTSEVGLVGDASGGVATPGELAMSDGQVLCIDELDKFKKSDLNALLEAMEEGEYRIRKGKIDVTFKARVRIAATTNDMSKLPTPLRDRFDFIFHLRRPTREERIQVVKVLLKNMTEEDSDLYDPKVLKLYLEYIRSHQPKIADVDAIHEYLSDYILSTKLPIEQVSYRSFELSIFRIAYAIAKLERKDLTVEHIKKAIRLKEQTYFGGYGDG